MECSTARPRRRTVRLAAAGLGAALLLAGCGFDVQTLQQYTPAQGVNVDDGPVRVRNLLIIGDGEGSGLLSASLLSQENDQLTGVSGQALSADGEVLGELTVAPTTIPLPANQLVVLTSIPQPITVQSSDMVVGGTVDLELRFASGAVASAIAPVMSANDSIYATITPSPAASDATASPSPTPEVTIGGSPVPVLSPTPGATP